MRFLLDQDVYAVTIRFLRELGHDEVPSVAASRVKKGVSLRDLRVFMCASVDLQITRN